jgi:hypothetical protein
MNSIIRSSTTASICCNIYSPSIVVSRTINPISTTTSLTMALIIMMIVYRSTCREG